MPDSLTPPARAPRRGSPPAPSDHTIGDARWSPGLAVAGLTLAIALAAGVRALLLPRIGEPWAGAIAFACWSPLAVFAVERQPARGRPSWRAVLLVLGTGVPLWLAASWLVERVF
jgi:hypothetical protein